VNADRAKKFFGFGFFLLVALQISFDACGVDQGFYNR